MIIPNGYGKEFLGIGLLELLWKATTGIIDWWLTTPITYPDSLCGFRTGWGMGTAILEAKLIHQLISTREAVLHTVLLDIQKAYEALDQDRCLNILEGSDMVPQTLQLLKTYWTRMRMVGNSGGYFGSPFQGYRGVTQGNPLYPTVFNMVVDTMIRKWVTVVETTEVGA